MDCQQHTKYSNQYRAMFVMNIGVDWDTRLMYDDAIGALKTCSVNGNSSSSTGTVVVLVETVVMVIVQEV